VFHNVLPSCVQRLSTRPEEKRAFDNSDFTTEFTIDPLDPFGSSVSISTAHCGLYYRDLFVPESSGVYLNRLFWTLYYIQEPHNTYNVYNFFYIRNRQPQQGCQMVRTYIFKPKIRILLYFERTT
jgi:hypothetical protein